MEQILEATLELFAERGFSGTSTNHIVDRLGMSVGALYRYFPNKQAILEELNRRYLAHICDILVRIHEDSTSLNAPDYVTKLVDSLVDFCEGAPAVHEVFFSAEESATTRGDETTFRMAATQIFSDFFQESADLEKGRANLLADVTYSMSNTVLQLAAERDWAWLITLDTRSIQLRG